MVTDCELTRASGADSSDATVGIDLLTREPEPVQVLGDSAYATGEALDTFAQTGHEPLVKPWPIKPAVPEGFTSDDFTVDEAAGTATCPNGITRPVRLRVGGDRAAGVVGDPGTGQVHDLPAAHDRDRDAGLLTGRHAVLDPSVDTRRRTGPDVRAALSCGRRRHARQEQRPGDRDNGSG